MKRVSFNVVIPYEEGEETLEEFRDRMEEELLKFKEGIRVYFRHLIYEQD